MMTHHPGFSDRIAHALAFAAKHGAARTRPGGSITWPTRPANVAVILARYGCDETTIIAGILSSTLDEADAHRRAELEERLRGKFSEAVMAVVRQVLETRHDRRGKERGWEARKLDCLANLTQAEAPALDVFAASQIHQCGALLSDVRRLGLEYLSSHAPGGAPTVLRWYADVITTFEGHPVGPRPGMLSELRELAGQLGRIAE